MNQGNVLILYRTAINTKAKIDDLIAGRKDGLIPIILNEWMITP